MPRQGVTLPSLKKTGVAGIKEMRDTIGHVLEKTELIALKDVFYSAGLVLFHKLGSEIDQHSPSEGNKQFPPGTLKRGLFITAGKVGKPNVLVGISGRDGANYLGIWLEHGTIHQPARPFFRPSVMSTRPEMADIIAHGIKNAIEEAAQ